MDLEFNKQVMERKTGSLRSWLRQGETLESLNIGDVVTLHKILFFTPHAYWPKVNAVYAGLFEGKRIFLELDEYIKHKEKREDRSKVFLYSTREEELRVENGEIQLINSSRKELRSDERSYDKSVGLLEEGLEILRKLYTFDKVVTLDRDGKPVKVEKNMCVL